MNSIKVKFENRVFLIIKLVDYGKNFKLKNYNNRIELTYQIRNGNICSFVLNESFAQAKTVGSWDKLLHGEIAGFKHWKIKSTLLTKVSLSKIDETSKPLYVIELFK